MIINKNIKIEDSVILVDENDRVIGQGDKYQAHAHPARLHRAVSVWLVNSEGEILLQQRSKKKITAANWWGNAICGNVRWEESYEACAYRRLKEELGITDVEIKLLFKFQYQAYCNQIYGEKEIDQVFVGRYDGKVRPNPKEVADLKWLKIGEINQLDPLCPWTKIMLEDERLLEWLTKQSA